MLARWGTGAVAWCYLVEDSIKENGIVSDSIAVEDRSRDDKERVTQTSARGHSDLPRGTMAAELQVRDDLAGRDYDFYRVKEPDTLLLLPYNLVVHRAITL